MRFVHDARPGRVRRTSLRGPWRPHRGHHLHARWRGRQLETVAALAATLDAASQRGFARHRLSLSCVGSATARSARRRQPSLSGGREGKNGNDPPRRAVPGGEISAVDRWRKSLGLQWSHPWNPARIRCDRLSRWPVDAGRCTYRSTAHEASSPRHPALRSEGCSPRARQAAASVIAGDVAVCSPERRGREKPGQAGSRRTSSSRSSERRPTSRAAASSWPTRSTRRGGRCGLRRALDVGASTGGFTDCLLQRGAEQVVAVDVAYGELRLAPALRSAGDRDRATNARSLRRDELPYAPDLIVIDVSFISLAKVLRRVLGCAAGAMTAWRWSSRSSRSAASRSARAASCAMLTRRRRGAPRGRPRRRQSSAPPCSGTRAPGCPARRATARRSSGWPRAGRGGVTERRVRHRGKVEP